MQHLKQAVNYRQTVQIEQALPYQVKNNAGGFVFKTSNLELVKRFLILGTEGGTYYATEAVLTKEAVNGCLEAIKAHGVEVVSTIVEISDQGRAPKNDYALFLLAAAASVGDLQTRRAAFNALPKVARTATHLFQFLEYTKQFRGWGRALKTAVAKWYSEKGAEDLAYQMVKYRNRNGWTHRDVLRKAHPSAQDAAHAALYDWACHDNMSQDLPRLVQEFTSVINTTDSSIALNALDRTPKLPWEAFSTQVLSTAEFWKGILPKLPVTALVRNLGRMTANGAITPFSKEEEIVVGKLASAVALQKARIHPVALFVAKRTYENGGGHRGSLSWTPNQQIVAALESAFYDSFKFVEPTNKRFYLGLDVSGSMDCAPIAGIPGLTAREGAMLMAMVTLRSEQKCLLRGFTAAHSNRKSNIFSRYQSAMTELKVTKHDSLNEAVRRVSNLPFGGTDCALPMLDALEQKIPVDTFVIYTDNETWAGNIHPHQALADYRHKMKINAKCVVVGMYTTGFSIADPSDKGMLDVVGFDTITPQVISEFSKL